MRRLALTALAAFAGTAVAAVPAFAHVILISPAPRSQDDGLVVGPCGGVKPTNNPTVYQAGSTITVKWSEDIDHAGPYRIAFSPANDQGFDQNILADNIPDKPGAPNKYQMDVTLPDTPCTGCTLQVIQKGNDYPHDYYYSCADIELTSGPAADAGQNSGGGSGGGGCAIAAGTAGSGGAGAGALSLVGLALAAAWTRRRKPATR